MTEKEFKIISRKGHVNLRLSDGEYHVKMDITIENGRIKYMDNGIWTKGYKGKIFGDKLVD